MYALLRDRIGKTAANAVFTVWYALLITLVVFYADVPQGVFRYLNW